MDQEFALARTIILELLFSAIQMKHMKIKSSQFSKTFMMLGCMSFKESINAHGYFEIQDNTHSIERKFGFVIMKKFSVQ